MMDELELRRLCNKHGIRYPQGDDKLTDIIIHILEALVRLYERETGIR